MCLQYKPNVPRVCMNVMYLYLMCVLLAFLHAAALSPNVTYMYVRTYDVPVRTFGCKNIKQGNDRYLGKCYSTEGTYLTERNETFADTTYT